MSEAYRCLKAFAAKQPENGSVPDDARQAAPGAQPVCDRRDSYRTIQPQQAEAFLKNQRRFAVFFARKDRDYSDAAPAESYCGRSVAAESNMIII